MSATLCAFILTFSTLCGSRVVSGVLSTPTNVRFTSYDMNLVLRWDSPEQPASDLVYTTEYRSSVVKDYRVGCVNISTHECDLTLLNVSIFPYGTYFGRVRAQSGTESSAWMESDQITLDKNTIISSPNVSLFSSGATIEVSIKDPEFAISALRNIFNWATYTITHWKDGQKEKARSMSNIQQNRVVLKDLDPWTKYCVQVQIITERNSSKPSTVVCERTTTEEEAPWVAPVVTFVVMSVAVALVVVAVVYRKHISQFLCPKDLLPQHFKENLLAPPKSSMYLAMHNSHPPEEIYHQVRIIETAGLEEGRPLEAEGSSCSKQPDT